METLLSEQFAPITSRIGFIEAPLDDVVEAFEAWRASLYPVVKVDRLAEGFPEALARLEPLTGGPRPRELLVAAGRWTAFFDNSLSGTDAESVVSVLTRRLKCQGVAISVRPHTYKSGGRNGRMGAVQFELFGSVASVRAVAVVFDGGRWRFVATGTEQSFEEAGAYESRTVRDRFTSEMLGRYCRALGVDVFEPNAYGPEAVFFESSVVMPADIQVMTLREAQDFWGIAPGEADCLPG